MKKRLIKLLFHLFKKDLLEYAFNTQSKPVSFELLSFKFIDSNGVRYYRYNDDFHIPMERRNRIARIALEIQRGLSSGELKFIATAIKDIINEILNYGIKKIKGEDLAKLTYLADELMTRENNIIEDDLLMEMLGLICIRENENPAKIDEDIHYQKLAQFKKDREGGLSAFFIQAGLADYIPFLSGTTNDLEQYSESQMDTILKDLIQDGEQRKKITKELVATFMKEKSMTKELTS